MCSAGGRGGTNPLPEVGDARALLGAVRGPPQAGSARAWKENDDALGWMIATQVVFTTPRLRVMHCASTSLRDCPNSGQSLPASLQISPS